MGKVRYVLGHVAPIALVTLFMSGQASAEVCVDMNLQFGGREPPRALVESMKKEAASIWESYGVWLQWPPTQSLMRCSSTLASFDVQLDQPPGPARSLRRTLGRTRLAVCAIDHAPIYIDLKATTELLGSVSLERVIRLLGRPNVGPEHVGRALGRILAHEVGHVLLAARDHQPRGLMRPSFAGADLLNPARVSYALSDAEITHLRVRTRALTALIATADGTDLSWSATDGSRDDRGCDSSAALAAWSARRIGNEQARATDMHTLRRPE